MKAILGLLFFAILVLCTWTGYKKGLIMGIGSLLAFAIAMYGANLLSTTFSAEVVDAMRPFADGYVETEIVDKTVRPALGIDSTNLSVTDFLAQNPASETEFCTLIYTGIGIYEDTARQMAGEAVAYAQEHGMGAQDAAVEVLCLRISFVVCFVIAFLLILIVLTTLGNIPNLSFKIPDFDLLNDVSGAVLGLAQGICFCLVLAWCLKFTGIVLKQEILADTALVSWFMSRGLMVRLLGI